MTVDTTDNTVTGIGDGVVDTLSFPYLVYQASHLTVTLDGVSTSAWSAATYGDSAGVTITFDSPPADGVAIVAQRIVPYTQNTDLENFDGNDSDVTEKEFDLLAMADQQLAEQVNRSILTPIGTTLTSNTISGTIDTTLRALTITTSGIDTAELGSFGVEIDTLFSGLASGDMMRYDGVNWVNDTAAETLTALGAASVTTANTWTKTQTLTKGSDVASASALTLGNGNYFDVTGTTAITSIATKGTGTVVKLHFDGALTLTHHATNLILPSGANIITAAGDEFEFTEYSTGKWRCTGYTLASGNAIDVAVGSIVNKSVYKYRTHSGITTPYMNYDDTIPQNTEGTEIFNETYTMVDSSNKLVITVSGGVAIPSTGTLTVIMGIFKDTDADAIEGIVWSPNAGSNVATPSVTAELTPAAASVDIKVRIGSTSGTLYLNGNASSRRLGGSMGFTLTIEEINV